MNGITIVKQETYTGWQIQAGLILFSLKEIKQMNNMTNEELTELRNKILRMTHDVLNTLDFYYLHGHSRSYVLYFMTKNLERHVEHLWQEFEELREAEKVHAEP